MNNGNVEPFRGFGHIAVMTRDVYAVSEELESAGVRFQKRPDEGKMKGISSNIQQKLLGTTSNHFIQCF